MRVFLSQSKILTEPTWKLSSKLCRGTPFHDSSVSPKHLDLKRLAKVRIGGWAIGLKRKLPPAGEPHHALTSATAGVRAGWQRPAVRYHSAVHTRTRFVGGYLTRANVHVRRDDVTNDPLSPSGVAQTTSSIDNNRKRVSTARATPPESAARAVVQLIALCTGGTRYADGEA
ncbi:hypothetical protein EVAR_27994_1 [Eumeta japonica]|uniref:Uncharacterized protein n=1 Tax=Eumeta variegata TaxID=151549 RepID=A0A4C1WB42_EUMVA|nr:hypothetical protein EVAR_27994_1 [Eumeta japonica]